MHTTYKATLRGNRIDWEDEVPDQIRTQPAIKVYVTILDRAEKDETAGPRMAEALERLALKGGVSSITDPAQWQREQREDRGFPGR